MIEDSLKRFGVILLALFLIFNITVTASYAIAVPDHDREGSIAVTMKDPKTGSAVSGGTMTLLCAGDMHEEDGNFSFVLTEKFKDSRESLENPDSELAQRLADYAREKGIDGKTVTIGNDGKAKFEDLEPGLYLLMQEQAAQGYYAVSPFIVSIPLLENGSYLYDVDATPKMELLSKKPDDAKPPGESPSKHIKTGDDSNMMVWGIVMLAALVIGVAVIIATKRQKAKQ